MENLTIHPTFRRPSSTFSSLLTLGLFKVALPIVHFIRLVFLLSFLPILPNTLEAQTTRLVGTGILGGGGVFAVNMDGSNPERLAGFPQGIYTLVLKSKDHVYFQKIIKN